VNRLRGWISSTFEVLDTTYTVWREDRAIRLGASLAYYALFAAIPLITLTLAVAGSLLSESEIVDFAQQLIAEIPSEEVRGALVAFAENIDTAGTIGNLTLLGAITGLFAGSVLFLAFQDTLGMIWDIPVRSGFANTVRRRLVAFGLILSIGVVLAAALALNTAIQVVESFLPDLLGLQTVFERVLVTALGYSVAVAAIASLFQVLVSKKLDWLAVTSASIVITVLLVVGNALLGWYFDRFGSVSVAGVLGSVMVVLLWLYYQAQIVVAGAELLKVLDARRASAA
jgi:membrane protein